MMGDAQTSGGGANHHQLHHHHQTGTHQHHPPQHHHHHHDTASLSFGLGFFPDPSDISSKSLPPFSSFGETEGLGEGLSGRLLDLGGATNGGPPPWDLYGEGLSARLIDVGAPTPLGLGIGVGVGLGLGFAPPPPSAIPARDQPPVAGGPGSVQYRPWESKNHPDSNGNPPTLLELGRMMAVTPPPGNTTSPIPSSNSGFSELQLFTPQQHGNSPKLPSFQSQFQHSYSSSPSPHPPALTPIDGFHASGGGGVVVQNNNNNVRYPLVPAPQRPEVVPGAFVHHERSAAAHFPAANPHYPLPAEYNNGRPPPPPANNGPSPGIIKLEADDSRSPFSSQGSMSSSTGRPDARKKEKRKYRASSMESSSSEASDAQVPSITSTARGFKHPIHMTSNGDTSLDGEKQSKKKRKRCGECVGCMRKDNCANCAPCRNDKSHQICKMRRCEKLTEKKIKIPREKGEGRAARNNTSSTNNGTQQQQQQPAATPPTPPTTNGNAANWERGYTPNSWAPSAQPAVVNGTEEWASAAGYQQQPEASYDPTAFNFNPLQQGGFHPPAPVVDTFTNGGNNTNGFRPRPSPQPQQIQIGGFSPHMTSPHPSPGAGPQMNGRCGSVPPHFTNGGQEATNGYMNGFTSPSPRPPSSNPPGVESNFRSNGNDNTSNGGLTGHPNGPPGYPSPSPHQSSHSNGGYPGQNQSGKNGESWEGEQKQQRSHEELNNRLKEKILNKQMQQQQQQQQHPFQHELQPGATNGNQTYYMNYPYNDNNDYNADQHFNPTSTSSPTSSSSNNVRLDVHLEPNGHFLGAAHPQNGGTGGGLEKQQTTSPPRNNPTTPGCQIHLTSAAHPDLDQDRMSKLKNNIKDEVPPCQCFPSDQLPPPTGPYYTLLGTGESLAALRQLMEQRTGLTGRAIRFEQIIYTRKEGRSAQGCPIAKWIIRRSGLEEKVLCLVKERRGHRCRTAWLIVASVAWEGLSLKDSDYLYDELVSRLNDHGQPTYRRCAINDQRTCGCQGLDPDTCGASFSFGCSWSMFYNGCKFARSRNPRKFRLADESQEVELEDRLQRFATAIAPLYKRMAPDAYANQVEFEDKAVDCRLGLAPGRPFAGLTACLDFCAHSHRDTHDMNNGCTVVTTLTRHRGFHKPNDDEQFHVLPHYVIADVDEYNSVDGQKNKVDSGAIEVLTKYPSRLPNNKATPSQQNVITATTFCERPANRNSTAERSIGNQFREAYCPEQHVIANPTQPANWSSPQQQQYPPQWLHARPLPLPRDTADNGMPPRQVVEEDKENFKDPNVGGVAIALTHGSVLFECAKHELHATTALRNPDRRNPTRISLVLYQHKNMNETKHGSRVFQKKMERKRIEMDNRMPPSSHYTWPAHTAMPSIYFN